MKVLAWIALIIAIVVIIREIARISRSELAGIVIAVCVAIILLASYMITRK